MGLVRLAWVLALAVGAGGCAASGAVPRPFPGAPAAPAPVAGADAHRVVETALTFRGVPYREGGSDPSGFDCSGLVQYAFAQHGIVLPREVRAQITRGREVPLTAIEEGDLIFFATTSDGPSHVGLAIGGDRFVHAPSSRGVVRVERFSSAYWARRIVAIRRLTDPRN